MGLTLPHHKTSKIITHSNIGCGFLNLWKSNLVDYHIFFTIIVKLEIKNFHEKKHHLHFRGCWAAHMCWGICRCTPDVSPHKGCEGLFLVQAHPYHKVPLKSFSNQPALVVGSVQLSDWGSWRIVHATASSWWWLAQFGHWGRGGKIQRSI